jgi:hypothetical protein
MVARAGAAVLAIVVCAWFALGVRAFRDQDAVIASLGDRGLLSAIQVRADRAALEDAATLNPDQGVILLRAQLDSRAGEARAALRLASQVSRHEPQNINAWLLIAVLAHRNSATYRSAAAHVRLLAPPVPQ